MKTLPEVIAIARNADRQPIAVFEYGTEGYIALTAIEISAGLLKHENADRRPARTIKDAILFANRLVEYGV